MSGPDDPMDTSDTEPSPAPDAETLAAYAADLDVLLDAIEAATKDGRGLVASMRREAARGQR